MAANYSSRNSTLSVIERASVQSVSMRDAFSAWLSDNNAKKYSPQVSVACLDRISEYVMSKNISCSLWEISRFSVFKPVYQKVMDAKLLRIIERNTYMTFAVVGQLYMKFLKEKPWETTAAEEIKVPFVPVRTIQNENKNLAIVSSNDESHGAYTDVIQIVGDYTVKYVDKRDSGGALWVFGGLELSDTMQKIAEHGFQFRFKADGGRSSDYQSAWWYKPSDLAEVSQSVVSKITKKETEQIQMIDKSSDESNDLKVGLYIRNKLRQLSDSGFAFSEQQLRDICDLRWSKLTFRIAGQHPFAKIVNGSESIAILAKDERGYNRYWNEAFTFGNVSLIIISQWYERNREDFDEWFLTLNQDTKSEFVSLNDKSDDGRKYAPLKKWLIENGNENIYMSFSEIADLIGVLPPSAYKYRAIWSNTDSHPISVAWTEAGYKVVDCNLQTQHVRFAKIGIENTYIRMRNNTVKAALIEFSNNHKGQVITRREIVEELSVKYGHNEHSILPADYEVGLNNSLPKLFRRIDYGTYECLGYNSAQTSSGTVVDTCSIISDTDKKKAIKIISTRFKSGFRKLSSISFAAL